MGDSDDEKVGAVSVLDSLARELPTDDEPFSRTHILNNWFSKDSSSPVRSAALGYLARNGIAEDFSFAKTEYDRSDPATFRSALECMAGILLRTGQGTAARQLVLESQFDSLETDILQVVLDGFENLETTVLLVGLKHRNAQVRLHTLKILSKRRVLDQETAERFIKDRNPSVRSEAIKALSRLGKSFAEEEVKEIMVRPREQPMPGIMGLATSGASEGMTGEELFERYKLESLKKCTEAELTQKVESSHLYDHAPYLARVEKNFVKYAKELRKDIDDAFGAYFEERLQRLDAALGHTPAFMEIIKGAKEVEEWSRKKLTRRGLDILCKAAKHEDLKRIRANLRGDYAGVSKADVGYLRKHGEWPDILLLAKAGEPRFGKTPWAKSDYEDFQSEVAGAVLRMSRGHSVSMLFSLELPATVLKRTIELCSELKFSKISQETLFALLDHESEYVRKAASIKSVRAFSAKRVKSILHRYIRRDGKHYYNVVHWLDLGASMSRKEARMVARAAGR